jgi:hypothetical protein
MPNHPNRSPIVDKARLTAAILMGRRTTSQPKISYKQVAEVIGHPHFRLNDIVGLVSWWCEAIGKQKLSMLVINESGQPGEGFFTDFWRDPFLEDQYEARLARLLAEDWTGVQAPTVAEMTAYYEEVLERKRTWRRGHSEE